MVPVLTKRYLRGMSDYSRVIMDILTILSFYGLRSYFPGVLAGGSFLGRGS